MPTIPLSAKQVLDRCFLEVRCKLLEIAAALDRIDRASGAEEAKLDPRRAKVQDALEILAEPGETSRAERLQLLFSRDYDPDWVRHLDQWRTET